MNASFTPHDLAALSPILIVLFGALTILSLESFFDSLTKKLSPVVASLTFILAIYATLVSTGSDNPIVTNWLRFDSTSRIFTLLFLTIGLASTFLAIPFFSHFESSQGEYYFLLLSSVFGLILIGASADFLTLFLGLETLSVALYIMCGYMKKWEISHESAIKYFLMGAMMTAVLLYGIALVYGAVGTTNLNSLLEKYHQIQSETHKVLFLTGIAFITIGFAFKAAIVPFHVWAPDVYEGASNPVTAFMAVGAKTGAFAAFVRVFLIALPGFNPLWNEMMTWLVYITLIFANLVALRQVQLRRFFAYSGISHAGFLLIPLITGTDAALQAIVFYLSVYAFATLGAFAVLSYLDNYKEGVMFHDLHGLFYRSPFLAGVLSLCLLTLAGFPPTAGFFAKFYLFKLAFQTGYYPLVIVGIIMTMVAAYYYLRIISYMLTDVTAKTEPMPSKAAFAVSTFSFLGILVLSCYPDLLLYFL